MTSVGFVGLGVMGRPMALNLLRAGHGVACYNRTTSRAESLVSDGAEIAVSVADAVAKADVVITMLPDSPDVQAVACAPGGIFDSAGRGSLWVDMSTIEPEVARKLSRLGAERGIRCLDAPVSGGEAGAMEGTLSIMVGGNGADLDQVRPILEVLGNTIVHVGASGAGQTVKAANQLIVAGTIELVAEALAFLEAQHVDSQAAVAVLAGGLAGNRILDRKAGNMLARDFHPGFRCALHHKDLGIFMSAARRTGTVTPVGALVTQLMAALVARGDGDLDHGALLKLVDELSGRSAPTQAAAVSATSGAATHPHGVTEGGNK